MRRRVTAEAGELLVGLLVLGSLAVLVRFAGARLPYLTPLVLAIVAGVLLVNVLGIPSRVEAGLETHDLWLKAGIVLLGASLPLGELLERGPGLLALVVVLVGVSLGTVELLSRFVVGIDRPLRSLLAAGASICGVSAVASVGASVDAGENDIAYAAGTILLFDAVTILAFPWLGHLLGLSDQVFGVWAGLSMFSTGPVVAAGMAYSPAAGQWATLTKLTRNALLGVVIVGYSLGHARACSDRSPRQSRSIGDRTWTVLCSLPVFLVGFLVVSGLASGGVLGEETVRSLEHARSWLFTAAFVGLGTELDADAVRGVGLPPIVATAAALGVAALLSLALIGVVLGP